MMRPLAMGTPLKGLLLHLAVLGVYGVASYALALHLVRRRLHR